MKLAQFVVSCVLCASGFGGCLAAGAGKSASIELKFDQESRVSTRATGQAAALEMKRTTPASRSTPGNAASTELPMPTLQFESGTEAQRSAKVVPDPKVPGNWVLEFWVGEPNVKTKRRNDYKSRVQMSINNIDPPAYEVYESVRLLLHEDMKLLTRFPEPVKWFTISEWWNNAVHTKESYPFRLSVHLRTAGAGSSNRIFIGVEAQAMQEGRDDFKGAKLWGLDNPNVEIPVGRWLKLEYFFREGKGAAGRFALAVTPEGGQRVVVFDVKDSTYHPSDPNPDGIRHLHPVKIYTSSALTDFVRENGGALRLYWDDLMVRACERPVVAASSECLSAWER